MNTKPLKYYITLLSLLIVMTVNAQNDYAMVTSYTPPAEEVNSVEVPKRLERKFRRDAARLALRMEADQEDLRYQNIVIPRDNVESIFSVLTNIYINDEQAKSIARCNVHTFPDPSIDQFKIIFDRTVDWAEPLREGITETKSDDINDLLDEYDLIIENHEKWTEEQDVIVVRSKEPMNIAALANEFYNIDGVMEIDMGIPEISGSDIKIERVEGGWEVAYILKFGGAYVKGAGKKHIWTYHAMDSGEVKFISEKGDEIPAYMKCESPKKQIAERG